MRNTYKKKRYGAITFIFVFMVFKLYNKHQKKRTFSERLSEIIESKILFPLLLLGIGAIFLLLDFLNPFLNFVKTASIAYVWKNEIIVYYISYGCTYFFLGYLTEKNEIVRLTIGSFSVPAIHYLLKGFLISIMILSDPFLLDREQVFPDFSHLSLPDFWVLYFGCITLFAISTWPIMICFTFLGMLTNYLLGKKITSLVRVAIKRQK